PGYQMVIYDGAFGGDSTTLTADQSCLVNNGEGRTSGNWNDVISTVRVQAIPTSQPPSIGIGTTVLASSGVQVGTQLEYPPGNGTTNASVGYFDQGDSISFSNVNLTGAGGLSMRVAGANSGGQVQVRADSAAGTLLGTFTMSSTGGWQTWQS